jgi:hypothetical protein
MNLLGKRVMLKRALKKRLKAAAAAWAEITEIRTQMLVCVMMQFHVKKCLLQPTSII